MSGQATAELSSGISRSGRVRKKSTKLMESLEISKNLKPEKPIGKFTMDKKISSPTFASPELITIKSVMIDDDDDDDEEAEEQIVEQIVETQETLTAERLPLSAEGLPLAVPASGYYTYQGQFSNVLPKPDTNLNKKPRTESSDYLSNSDTDKTSDPMNVVVKQEIFPFDVDEIEEKVDNAVKKKKSLKYKDHQWNADWEKLKKKKKKKKEKEKIFKAMKRVDKLSKGIDGVEEDSDDSNSGSFNLVIAEPPITLPPKKRVENKKTPDFKKRRTEVSKAKKNTSPAIKPVDAILNFTSDINVGLKLENLADGGTIDESDLLTIEEKPLGSQCGSDKKKARKKNKKITVASDGTVKKRKPRPITAYMLWCKENRPRIVAEDKSMDFAAISRRMGEVWQTLTDKEKMMYRRRAKKMGRKGSMISTGKKTNARPSNARESLGMRKLSLPFDDTSTSAAKRNSSVDLVPVYKVTGTEPIDVAAHLKLLGESLMIIGQRLTEHEGHIAVSGSLSVLLDSTLCALGPLFCLTNQIEELDIVPKEEQAISLDNIAYFMPGL